MSRRYNSSLSSIGYPRWTPAVRAIIITCVAVFVLQHFFRLITLFGLTPALVTHKLYLWQLVSYIFLHDPDSITHILFNMLGVWMFGSDLERFWGTRRFTEYFFVCGIGAGLFSALLSWNSTVPTVGASGALYGILLAFGLLFPERIIILVIFPIPARWFVAILGAIAFWSSLATTGGGVAHVAHLGGMLVGFLFLRGDRLIPEVRRRYEVWRHNRLRKKFEVYYNDRHRDNDREGRRWKN